MHPLKQALPVLDYLLTIRRKLWMLIVIFVLVFGLTAYITFKQNPIYQATCQIGYTKSTSGAIGGRDSPFFWLNPYFNAITFETEKHIMESKSVAEGVVEKLNLASPDKSGAWKKWVRRVQSAIRVTRIKDARIYLIIARSTEPELARDIANTAAEVYIELSLGEKKESARRSLSLLTNQISDLKNQIEESRMAMVEYLDREGAPEAGAETATDPEKTGSTTTASLLNNLHSRLVQLRIERGQYLTKYKEKHPKLKEIEREIQVLLEVIRVEEERLNLARKRAIEYEILKKRADVNEDLYNILLKKLTELDLSKGAIESNTVIIERAETPAAPIAPQKKRNLTLGALLGFFLGLGAIFVTEYFDPTLQTPAEAESYLDLPVLASIPRMVRPGEMKKGEGKKHLFLISAKSPRSHEAEMFKSLRTNIRFTDFKTDTLALLVTSSSPREGKTTIATNLAITTAHADSRTILIDTDMRRPDTHNIFNVKNETGISSFLKGEASLENIILPTSINGLSIIPSGPVPSNPSELLESPRIKELITVLKSKYDRVIFDSPPAGALADARIIASIVDGVILVCFAGHIDRKFVLRTKQQLEKAGAKIYGVVLNYIELKLRSYYYYYHSVYQYGYH